MPSYQRADFSRAPFIVFYELTQACQLACRHCRASAQPNRHPDELPTETARALLASLASFDPKPLVVLTGGDPLEREDVFELVEHGRALGLEMAMTPSATPRVTPEALAELKARGLSRLALSLDGADAATHDSFRGSPGSFERTLNLLREARSLGLPLQVNTTLSARNAGQLAAMVDLLAPLGIDLWSVFFLVPVGRGALEARLEGDACERAFEELHALAQRAPFAIKTTEAPHYRRFALQHGERASERRSTGGRAPLGLNDGRGTLFVSHTGEFFPSGFLPERCGRFPIDSPVVVYQTHPLFVRLRDPDGLEGKCGRCEYRDVCGGSRARACALTGNPFAEEPDCVHVPLTRLGRRAGAAAHGAAS
jgi:radical SAM protein